MSMKRIQISLNMYTVRSSNLPFEEQLKKVRDIGYQSIQTGLVKGHSKEELKSMLDSLGMEISVYCGDLYDIHNNIEAYIEDCRYFGCDEIMIGTMPTEFRGDAEGYMAAIKLMNEVGQKLAKGGVYLSYHNHAQEFRRFKNSKTGMDILYENLDPNVVHFILDTHWIQAGGGDVIQWIEKSKDRMQYIHVKDYRIGPANYFTGIGYVDKQFAEVGEGNLPWPLIVKTCLQQNIKAFIVEQDFSYGEDSFECASISYQNLISFGLR
jgi:sugar phosphate isomerase/epimerase